MAGAVPVKLRGTNGTRYTTLVPSIGRNPIVPVFGKRPVLLTGTHRYCRATTTRIIVCIWRCVSPSTVYFFFFFHTLLLLDKPWSQVSSLLCPGTCLHFLSRIGFSNPTARRSYIECCYLTLSRFPQVNLCARKSPHEIICISHPCRIPPRCCNNLIQKRTTRFITRIRSIYHSPSGIMSYYRYDTTQDIYSPEMQDAQATTFLPVV